MYDSVNVDWSINMSATDGWMSAGEAAAPAPASPHHALRVCQSRICPLAADAGTVARATVFARRCRAAAAADRGAPRPGQGGRPFAAVGTARPRVIHHVHRRQDALLPRPRRGAAVALAIGGGGGVADLERPVRWRVLARAAAHRRRRLPARQGAALRAARAGGAGVRCRSSDHAAFDLRAPSVAHAGWRILHLLTRIARLSRTVRAHHRSGPWRTRGA